MADEFDFPEEWGADDGEAEAEPPVEDAMQDAEAEVEEAWEEEAEVEGGADAGDDGDFDMEANEAAACAEFDQNTTEGDEMEEVAAAPATAPTPKPSVAKSAHVPKTAPVAKSAPATNRQLISPKPALIVPTGKGNGKVGQHNGKGGKGGKSFMTTGLLPPGSAKGAGKGSATGAGKGSAKGAGKGGKGPKGGGKVASNASKGVDKGKGKSKEPTDGGVGRRVLELNRVGHWPKGRGVDVQALVALRGCDAELASSILSELESEGAGIENPSRFVHNKIKQGNTVEEGNKGSDKGSKGVGKHSNKGTKRSAPGGTQPPAKRAAVAPAEEQEEEWDEEENYGGEGAEETWEDEDEGAQEDWNEEEEDELEVELPIAVANKIQLLQKKGVELSAEAIGEIAQTEQRDALVVLEAVVMREKLANPSEFVLVSLRKRAEMKASKAGGVPKGKAPVGKAAAGKASPAKAPATKLGSKAPAAKAPISNAPAAKMPAAKLPAGKPPVAKVQAAKAPVGKAQAPLKKATPPASKGPVAKQPQMKEPPPQRPKPSLSGKPPKPRTGLVWELDAVQSKVLEVNDLGLWEGDMLDDAVLDAILRIEAARGFEILEEVEELGAKVSNPSKYVLNLIAEEEERVKAEQQ
eukprot:TRINITY_DN56519_c0_g1_i1.p1 TRINITY_DN56519_c0_g1~~TRINITY_DN56519_c0_g1_i1.p1  ORF type:complete len:636 (-),score=183.31 TRINITY_DN56519_c0_g1_i1:289-2196(-)